MTSRVLEIGTSDGSSALLFALNTPDECKIVTLDVQLDNPTVGSRFRNHPLAHKIQMILQPLEVVAPDFEPQSFDLIFVDGAHGYRGVMQDSLLAKSLIRPGGIICWHDYTFSFRDGVVRALDELSHDMPIVKIAHYNLAVAIAPMSSPSGHK